MSSESTSGLRRLAVNLALVAVGTVGAGRGAYEVLRRQARIARREIPKPTGRPFDGDGLYAPGATEPRPWTPGLPYDLHVMVFGDSLAAGLGAETAGQLPGVLLARGLTEESGLTVRLSIKAIVGATSRGLAGQIDAMRIAGGSPDVSVILVGGNDVTARNGVSEASRLLGRAVEMLVASGSTVVVGTCPDLGTVKPVPQPLRSVLHTLSVRLAAAQTAQVTRAGGRAVSLSETLAPEFHADPERLFSADRFHPNSAGYELAAGLLLPAVCEELGVWDAPGAEETHREEPAPDDVAPPEEATHDEQSAGELSRPSDSVVARLTRRLTDFARAQEDTPGRSQRRGWHDERVDTADTGDAREAADTLRRRSRILGRLGQNGRGGGTTDSEKELPCPKP